MTTMKKIDKYNGSAIGFNLPTAQDGKRIYAIGGSAFYSNSTLKQIGGNGILRIEDGSAFKNCSALRFATFNNCSYIGQNAFNGCNSLLSISFPNCTFIASSAFAYCDSLKFVDMKECTYIGNNAFNSCLISSLTLPKCETLCSAAFSNCSLFSKITLPSGSMCTLSNSNAFAGTMITSSTGSIVVTISLMDLYKSANQWSYFSNRIFDLWDTNPMTYTAATALGYTLYSTGSSYRITGYTGGKSILSLPTTIDNTKVNDIYTSAFSRASTYLTNVEGNSILSIHSSAFRNCTKLCSVNFYKCLNVGKEAFSYCLSLTTANLPNCSRIDSYAFYYCQSLTSVSFPKCSFIDYDAFYYCKSLYSANFQNCTSISGNAFYSCTSLENINLPNCSYLGDGVFSNCTSLSVISLPKCEFIGGSYTFYGTPFLNNQALTSGYAELNTDIGNKFLLRLNDMRSFTGSHTFICDGVGTLNMNLLSSINFPSCTYIGSYALTASNLANVNFPVCNFVGRGAFNNTSFMKTQLAASGYAELSCANGNKFLLRISSASKFTSFSKDHTFVCGDAAQYCYSLSSVRLSKCSYIGRFAFYECSSLRYLYLLSSSVCTLEDPNALYGTKFDQGIGRIYVPASLVNMYEVAENWSYYGGMFYGV